ncbi:uncharacterized protein B0I36DRAFT_394428 [Microdochium trichocladiopsis]|uniref:Chromo domain-containing protein n=1 Tax=Microdochium trichocladiopsis TaxID=1682393 RepID=A0A9P9BLF1_9PEZI|nr:uncharacterized protein B0I36DRAFT_394428 [Microdochium trichocladiopsis]KAH7021657.1 hypothetical protein B0I36DRAFT_394428 [Microdochium trichocladiopsis]
MDFLLSKEDHMVLRGLELPTPTPIQHSHQSGVDSRSPPNHGTPRVPCAEMSVWPPSKQGARGFQEHEGVNPTLSKTLPGAEQRLALAEIRKRQETNSRVKRSTTSAGNAKNRVQQRNAGFRETRSSLTSRLSPRTMGSDTFLIQWSQDNKTTWEPRKNISEFPTDCFGMDFKGFRFGIEMIRQSKAGPEKTRKGSVKSERRFSVHWKGRPKSEKSLVYESQIDKRLIDKYDKGEIGFVDRTPWSTQWMRLDYYVPVDNWTSTGTVTHNTRNGNRGLGHNGGRELVLWAEAIRLIYTNEASILTRRAGPVLDLTFSNCPFTLDIVDGARNPGTDRIALEISFPIPDYVASSARETHLLEPP